jgi:hypothetical protein
MQKPVERQFISMGDMYYQMAGEILNPSPLTQTIILEMVQKDETILNGLNMLVGNISGAIGKYQNSTEEIKNLVDSCYQSSNTSLNTVLNKMYFDTISYGYGVAEIVWKIQDGKIILSDIIPLSPVLTSFKSENGTITSVVYVTALGNKIEIPIEKCLVIRRGTGIYGETILSPIYSTYKFKSTLKKWWAIAMERYAIPLLGVKTSQPEMAMQALGQWYSKAQFVMPLDAEVQIIAPPGDMSKSFQESIEYLNLLMFRGLMVPQMLGSIQQVGTYSLAKIHIEIFNSYIAYTAKSFSEQIIDGLVQKIIDYNIGIVEDYGSYQISIIPTSEEMKTMAETLAILNNTGIADPTEKWQRDWFKIIPEGDIPPIEELQDIGFGAQNDK